MITGYDNRWKRICHTGFTICEQGNVDGTTQWRVLDSTLEGITSWYLDQPPIITDALSIPLEWLGETEPLYPDYIRQFVDLRLVVKSGTPAIDIPINQLRIKCHGFRMRLRKELLLDDYRVPVAFELAHIPNNYLYYYPLLNARGLLLKFYEIIGNPEFITKMNTGQQTHYLLYFITDNDIVTLVPKNRDCLALMGVVKALEAWVQ